jgi:predicted acetyltransferase
MAATNTIISGVVNILRVTENTEWICTNIFRNLEVNFNGLYHDLAILYRDITGNHSIMSRQINQVFIVLNRMYKGFKQIINGTGKDIIERIFESISITYQQINQDMNTDTRNILSRFNDQFSELSNTVTSNLNIIRISFQTMDANDRLILLSNSEIKEVI